MKLSEHVDIAIVRLQDPSQWTRWTVWRAPDPGEEKPRVCAAGALAEAFGGVRGLSPLHKSDRVRYGKVVSLVNRLARKAHAGRGLSNVNDGLGREAALAVLIKTSEMLKRWGF